MTAIAVLRGHENVFLERTAYSRNAQASAVLIDSGSELNIIKISEVTWEIILFLFSSLRFKLSSYVIFGKYTDYV